MIYLHVYWTCQVHDAWEVSGSFECFFEPLIWTKTVSNSTLVTCFSMYPWVVCDITPKSCSKRWQLSGVIWMTNGMFSNPTVFCFFSLGSLVGRDLLTVSKFQNCDMQGVGITLPPMDLWKEPQGYFRFKSDSFRSLVCPLKNDGLDNYPFLFGAKVGLFAGSENCWISGVFFLGVHLKLQIPDTQCMVNFTYK